MSCVNISHPEFKAQARRLNLSTGFLRNLIHEYLNTVGRENLFPTDSWILDKVYGNLHTVSTLNEVRVWTLKFSLPLIFKTLSDAEAYRAEAAKYFNPEYIRLAETRDNEFVVTVTPPVNTSTLEKFTINKSFIEGTPVEIARNFIEEIHTTYLKAFNPDWEPTDFGGTPSISYGKLTIDMLNQMSFYKELSEHIFNAMGRANNTLQIIPSEDIQSIMAFHYEGTKLIINYNPTLLARSTQQGVLRVELILEHELIHSVTSAAADNYSLGTATEAEKLFVDLITNIIIDLNDNHGFFSNLNIDPTVDTASYVKEFIADVMTNKETLLHLASIKVSDGTFFSKIKNTIKRFLSKLLGKSVSDTYLEKIFDATTSYIDNLQENKSAVSRYALMSEGEFKSEMETFRQSILKDIDNEIESIEKRLDSYYEAELVFKQDFARNNNRKFLEKSINRINKEYQVSFRLNNEGQLVSEERQQLKDRKSYISSSEYIESLTREKEKELLYLDATEALKRFITPLDEMTEGLILYTPIGKLRQTYTIKGSHIYNKEGQEVFKEDSVDRNKIFANFAILQGRAVVVEYKGLKYVINDRDLIISVTSGKIMQWPSYHGDRLAITAQGRRLLREKKQQQTLQLSQQQLGPETKINIYAGTNENADLSNFAERPFETGFDTEIDWAGGTFKNVEAAFQAAKLNFVTELPMSQIVELAERISSQLRTASGTQARTLGRSIKGLDTTAWDVSSSVIMKQLLKASFEQNPQALQRLLDTGNATLTHTLDKGKWGTEFPKLLMEVREELRGTQQLQSTLPITDIQIDEGVEMSARMLEGTILGRSNFDKLMSLSNEELSNVVKSALARNGITEIDNAIKWAILTVQSIKNLTTNYEDVSRALAYEDALNDMIPTEHLNKMEEFRLRLFKDLIENQVLPYGTYKEHSELIERVLGFTDKEYSKEKKGYPITKTELEVINWLILNFADVSDYGIMNTLGDLLANNDPINPINNTEQLLNLIYPTHLLNRLRYVQETATLQTITQQAVEELSTSPLIEEVALEQQETIVSLLPYPQTPLIVELQTLTLERTERNAKYLELSTNLLRGIDNLTTNTVGLTNLEIQEIAEQCVYWISDRITDYLENPEKLLQAFPNKAGLNRQETLDKISNMSRVEVVKFIGPENFINLCKLTLFKENPAILDDFDLMDLADVLADNMSALLRFALTSFIQAEGFAIVTSETGLEIKEDLNMDNDNFNESNLEHDVLEEEGNLQEHWLIESRTDDVLTSMSLKVKAVLNKCYDIESYDDKGNPIYKLSKFGVRKRMNSRDATNSILRWVQGSITYSDMLSKLKAKSEQHPWINQIITLLEIQEGKDNPNADFLSLFFGAFCKHFLPYAVVIKDEKTGKYKTINVNEFPALKEAISSVDVLIKTGEHVLFTPRGINVDNYNLLNNARNNIFNLIFKDKDTQRELSEVNREELIKNLGYASNILGYYVTPEIVDLALVDTKAMLDMYSSLSAIADRVGRELHNKEYEPLVFDKEKNPNGIRSFLRNFLKPITDTLEDTAVSSFYDSGKMYQSYVIPSYTSKLFLKFNLEGLAFDDFIRKEYADYSWFKQGTNIERGWRNEWLRLLVTDPEARKIFKHKVLLNFDGENYMRGMDDAKYTLSLITEFFSTVADDKQTMIPAWYRVPMLSNKPSSEFILFYRYHGDFSRDIEGQPRSNAKLSLIDGFTKIFFLELSRIQSCEMRNLDKNDPNFIKNYDKNGKKFCFLDYFNDYLTGSKKDTELGKLIKNKIEGKELSPEDSINLEKLVGDAIAETMDNRVDLILLKWRDSGIIEGAKKVSNVGISDAEVLNNLAEFIWNDAFAAMNIMLLTITDIAYYKDAEDLQKRLALIHAPGIRANIEATDYNGNRVSDGKFRTVLLTDFDDFKSNIIDNVSEVFDRKIALASTDTERKVLISLKESLVGEDGAFTAINVADAQGYSSPTSYRKKAFLFGKWSKQAENIYLKLLKGEYNYRDLLTAFLPLKPFVYSLESRENVMLGTPLDNLKVPVLFKNSEYLLIMADAILQGELTGRPNLLRAIYEVMEESAAKDNTRGIDTFLFESTCKSGLQGRINIKLFLDVANGEVAAKTLLNQCVYNQDGSYNSDFVREVDFEDYCIQLDVPEHFKDHDLAHGSLIRYIIPSDLESSIARLNEDGSITYEPVTYDYYDPATDSVKKLNAEDFKMEYENTIAKNIQESINTLSEELGIGNNYVSLQDRNIALSKILQREILSSPRYGIDLLQACSVDENGLFRIPLGDPIQSKRVELLINSIIKNRVNKLKIAGGPVVQVTNFGTSRELNIRFKDKKGNMLLTKKEFEAKAPKDGKAYNIDEAYKKYIQDNQGGIAYFEVFAPIYCNELFKEFADKDGNIDIDVIEKLNPDLLKMIGYRI